MFCECGQWSEVALIFNLSLDDPDDHMPSISTGIRVKVTNRPQELCHLAQSALRGLLFQISGWGRGKGCTLFSRPRFQFPHETIYLAWATYLWVHENQVRESSRSMRSRLLCPEACRLLASFKSTCQGLWLVSSLVPVWSGQQAWASWTCG